MFNTSAIRQSPRKRPLSSLFCVFAAWKVLLILLALASPGPGYDTSTDLAFRVTSSNSDPGIQDTSLTTLLARKLTRWDAIHFAAVGNRGYVFEQDWAWGLGFTRLIALCTSFLTSLGIEKHEYVEALVAIGIAHVSHFMAAVVLYYFTRAVIQSGPAPQIAFVTACLHIMSPGGLFLSAPYAESAFAFLNFSGCLLLAKRFGKPEQASLKDDMLSVAAGICFGLATTFRSNGLLSGLLFLREAFVTLGLLTRKFTLQGVRHLVATGLAGVLLGIGFLIPQYIAYREFCGPDMIAEGELSRPWCTRLFPSIYTFVQGHYWNVGFLRYWTLSNMPLFLLAAPMLGTMSISSAWALRPQNQRFTTRPIVKSLAGIQLFLAGLAFTSYHVQIISRLASGYPVVYIWLAAEAAKRTTVSEIGVRCMVMYAVIQGGLFASFLPPA